MIEKSHDVLKTAEELLISYPSSCLLLNLCICHPCCLLKTQMTRGQRDADYGVEVLMGKMGTNLEQMKKHRDQGSKGLKYWGM